MSLPPIVQAIVAFVRQGYPQGVPEHDYLPLFALLRLRLTEDEVEAVAADLAAAGPDQHNAATIAAAIARRHDQPVSPAEVERVRQRLVAAGWSSGGE